jgi:hypothetical protein
MLLYGILMFSLRKKSMANIFINLKYDDLLRDVVYHALVDGMSKNIPVLSK